MPEKQGLYHTINNHIQEQECILCTVLDGDPKYGKILFSGGKKVWASGTSAVLTSMEEELLDISESGPLNVGDTRIFCERFGGNSRLVVCGAGHVSIPIIKTGKRIGFHVTVLEDRPMFADHARWAGADQVVCDNFEHGMEQISGGNNTYFIIVTRGHRYDMICLERALEKDNAYIGMMGSRKRVRIMKDHLMEKGIRKDLLEQVHAPIGLSIGAESPEEIAVSIMAEIIQVKNSHRRTEGYAGEILEALLEQEETGGSFVLATIISRKGSAPRGIGTKMLVYPDGRTIGTIGGGCLENEVIVKARGMSKGIGPSRQVIKLDMTGKEAEDWGMICGGVIEVYLERGVR